MISSEVQRTLVKSPPELWAELSDPDALGRHLGELGEIRITRAEPEKRVEWEAEGTSGSVFIKPSGWGTKVTLSVTREVDAPVQDASKIEPSAIDQEGEQEPPAELEPEPPIEVAATEAEATPIVEEHTASEAALEPTPPSEPSPQPAPRRGFFARLFGRRRPKVAELTETSMEEHATTTVTDSAPTPLVDPSETSKATIVEPPGSSAIESLQARFQAEPASEPVDEDEAEPEAEPELVAETAEPVAEAEAPPEATEPPRDLAAELKAAEEVAAEEVTAVLTAVLDRLGAAHHRPFSRA